jgi:GTPase SAR1 family protein
MWDIGGQKAIREYWGNYYENTDGIVWVIDSADDIRLEEATNELTALISEKLMEKVPLLIYCNK